MSSQEFVDLPQPDQLAEREKEDGMGAYLMIFAAFAVGLPLPVVNLIAALIYYFIKKKIKVYSFPLFAIFSLANSYNIVELGFALLGSPNLFVSQSYRKPFFLCVCCFGHHCQFDLCHLQYCCCSQSTKRKFLLFYFLRALCLQKGLFLVKSIAIQ